MTTLVLSLAITLYLSSAVAYGAAFARPRLARTARAALALAGAGFFLHGVAIGMGCRETGGQHLLTGIGAAGLMGWLAAGAFLVVQRSFQKAAIGAFALPLIVAAVIPSVVAPHTRADAVAATLATIPAVRLHVTTAAAGIALFALACTFGLMYLLQHRELKGKRFGPLLSRLPSLHALDRINGTLIAVGFVVFTVAVASGAVLATRAWCAAWSWDGQQVASVVVWLVFGAMVLARRAGSSGRRQAVLTVVAFTLAMTWLVGIRQVQGTKHAGFGVATTALACVDPT